MIMITDEETGFTEELLIAYIAFRSTEA